MGIATNACYRGSSRGPALATDASIRIRSPSQTPTTRAVKMGPAARFAVEHYILLAFAGVQRSDLAIFPCRIGRFRDRLVEGARSAITDYNGGEAAVHHGGEAAAEVVRAA